MELWTDRRTERRCELSRDRGLSWRIQEADEIGVCESRKAEDEQGGQDMRNLWHPTQLRKKK